jgi:hypothetical protein
MTVQRRVKRPTLPSWSVPEHRPEFTLPNGRGIVQGDELRTSRLRGRWRFVAHVVSDAGEWLDVSGPIGRSSTAVRSIPVDSITTIHRSRTPSRR